MERTIKGKITGWGKDIKPFFQSFKVVVHLDTDKNNYGHQIVSKSENALKNLVENYSIGTEVEFIEEQNGIYWNYKKGSWKGIFAEKRDEPQPPQAIELSKLKKFLYDLKLVGIYDMIEVEFRG